MSKRIRATSKLSRRNSSFRSQLALIRTRRELSTRLCRPISLAFLEQQQQEWCVHAARSRRKSSSGNKLKPSPERVDVHVTRTPGGEEYPPPRNKLTSTRLRHPRSNKLRVDFGTHKLVLARFFKKKQRQTFREKQCRSQLALIRTRRELSNPALLSNLTLLLEQQQQEWCVHAARSGRKSSSGNKLKPFRLRHPRSK
ncbi:hypothetical protein CEXT_320081 [Caerostris extrusa]|uniref:Uncharacterized protein n=1 Tax=Caerostris extrusa TaxID=172846 RepID=A0AAV4X1C6_CAEEX|nr:hypothetical protein CEXT_320081 [Caerostris extrusa]